ncbi:MAG: AAA family ATPase [Desulfobacteraceae bacterium]|nr:AAA family ATPase [Desulfobacteraceae bacterium]
MNQKIKKIPYGQAEFGTLRKDNCYYVDKTRFIPLLEASSRYIFFIRPRRFGKSLWLSVLQYYYDINDKDRFEEMFGGTYIFDHPTEDRNSYLIMTFNFAAVNPDPVYIRESFEDNGRAVVEDFLERYPQYFSQSKRKEILSIPTTEGLLRRIFSCTARDRLKLYMFIDEYDNFANTILSTSGKDKYEKLTRGQGFFRFFFNLLKTATSEKGSGLDKLFITGVSPVTMDDVTSGMNIGKNLTRSDKFNELMGFTGEEVRTFLTYYAPAEMSDRNILTCLEVMKLWYDNYKFSNNAENVLFNSDMVLYCLMELSDTGRLPEDMIDQNIRIDYTKLRHLMLTDRKLNGNFSELKKIIETGETQCQLQASFPLEHLTCHQNFISLLFYFGLLSIRTVQGERQLLSIPNITVKKLMYGYIRDAFDDTDIFRIDIWELAGMVHEMAYCGDWKPVFRFIAEEIKEQTSVRNYLDGERAVQMFLLAYLNISNYYLCQTEREISKGYADIFLEPFLAKFPDIKYGYLIEMKYIKRSEYSEAMKHEKIRQAENQLQKYANDEKLKKLTRDYTLKRLILIYKGWELVHDSEMISEIDEG